MEKKALKTQSAASINEASLLKHITKIIESRKNRAGAYANREVTLMYWEIGRYIGSVLLGGERAEYGKQILATLSQELIRKYGKSFELRSLRRMIQFAELFPNIKIVSTLSTQLSWSHFIEILPLKTEQERLPLQKFLIIQYNSPKEIEMPHIETMTLDEKLAICCKAAELRKAGDKEELEVL